MYRGWMFQHRDEMYMDTHILPANSWFQDIGLRNCSQVRWMVFRAEVASALELAVYVRWTDEYLILCMSTVAADSLRCNFGKKGIRPCGFHKASPCVCLLQPSTFYDLETQHPTSSLARPQGGVIWIPYCVSFIMGWANPHLAILHLFKASVSNGSGPPFRVWVRVQTESLPNWRSGLSINPNCQLGYGLKVNSQPGWIRQVVSRSPSGSIYRLKSGSCFWSLLIVSYQNGALNNQ